MKIVAALSSPHQDDVIERVLRHLHLWDPPWVRVRKARGPPPMARGAAVATTRRSPADHHQDIDPVIDDELYCVDDVPALRLPAAPAGAGLVRAAHEEAGCALLAAPGYSRRQRLRWGAGGEQSPPTTPEPQHHPEHQSLDPAYLPTERPSQSEVRPERPGFPTGPRPQPPRSC